MARTAYADPVVNFSVSCDPQLLKRLNDYATKHQTKRSWIVRKALIEWFSIHDRKPITDWTCMRCFEGVPLYQDKCAQPDCTYIATGPHLEAIEKLRRSQG